MAIFAQNSLVKRSLMVASTAALALGLAACGANAEKTGDKMEETATPSASQSAMMSESAMPSPMMSESAMMEESKMADDKMMDSSAMPSEAMMSESAMADHAMKGNK